MIYILVALQILQVILLGLIAVMVLQNHTKMEWLRLTLIPFLTSLSRFLNPDKK